MRYSQVEKMEIIRMVEESEMSVRATLQELDVNRRSLAGFDTPRFVVMVLTLKQHYDL